LIPSSLLAERRWLVYWLTPEGKKPPVDGNGRPDSDWHNPRGYLTHAQALERLAACRKARPDRTFALCLADQGGIDFDDCVIADGSIDPRAAIVLDRVPGYVERSPSGKGLKLFARAGRWLEINFKDATESPKPIEKKPLHFAVTGDVYRDGDPTTDIEKALDDELLMASPGHNSKTSGAAALPAEGALVRAGGQDDWLRNRAWMHANRGLQYEDVLAQLRVDIARCPAEGAPWTEHDLQRHAKSACDKVATGERIRDDYETDDAGAAAYFAATRGHLLRYDHRRGRWLLWDGVRWAPDRDEAIVRMLIEAARERVAVAMQIEDGKIRKSRIHALSAFLNENKIRAVRTLVRALPPVASIGDEWDTDPWLLGVPNGVVDLRTGTLRAAHQEDRITMQTAVAFDAASPAPLWETTIGDVFKDKPEGFVAYVQRALGYSITGDMRAEVFWLLLGVGRNGKGTLVNTVHHVLGDYAESLKFASLEARRNSDGGQGPTPDLAKLHRKRFVVASEGSGSTLNTALIKQITGRDPLTTRGMYARDEFTFYPEVKLWLTAQTDKRPRIRDDSEGFWARPHVVDFAQRYKDRADETLKTRLKDLDEAAGVLAWLVRGALEWQRQGLGAPPCVTAAADDYRLSQEPLAEFYEARCVLSPGAWTSGEELREAYIRWCDAERVHFRIGPKRFSQELVKRFTAYQEKTGTRRRGFQGIGLAVSEGHREPGEDDALPF